MDKKRIEEIRAKLKTLKVEFGISGKKIHEHLIANRCKQAPMEQSINQFINGKYTRLNDEALELLEQFVQDKKQILYRL